jgi:hypothetical protein
VLCCEDLGESGDIAPKLFDLGTRWMLVINFTPRLLYPQFPFDKRLLDLSVYGNRKGKEGRR